MRCGPGAAPVRSPGRADAGRDDELDALIFDCLELLLPTLPPDQARIVRAVDVEGALPASFAEKHGLDLDEVTACLVLGRQGLRNRFGEMHVTCSQCGPEGRRVQSEEEAET